MTSTTIAAVGTHTVEGRSAVVAAVGYPEVVRAIAEVEPTGADQYGRPGVRPEQLGEHVVEVTVPGMRHRGDVVHALPYLVVPVLAEGTPTVEERLDLNWPIAEHNRLHPSQPTVAACRRGRVTIRRARPVGTMARWTYRR